MWGFVVLTTVFLLIIVYSMAMINKDHVLNHWADYNKNPFFVFFLAPLYKPDDDDRSRLQFGIDNFFNVLMTFCTETFQVLMQPIMAIFTTMTEAVDQSANGLFNMRDFLKIIWARFNSMTQGFMNRFQATLTALKVTYTQLYNAIGKTYAISIAGLMSGLAALQTTLSIFDLIVNIVITILIILAAIFIWLPFILIPVIIIIIIAVNAINASGQGDRMTGIAGVFCFAEGTLVQTKDGPQPIERITLGTTLDNTNNRVAGLLNFEQYTDDMYDLFGVQVSGSHIVYTPTPVHVQHHPDAIKLAPNHRKVYCLITSTRRIPIHTEQGIINFADWEELDNSPDDLQHWNKHVFTHLNPSHPYKPPPTTTLMSESGVSDDTPIATPNGAVLASELRPGHIVLDANELPTVVRGVVRLANSESMESVVLPFQGYMSIGTWIKPNKNWIQIPTIIRSIGSYNGVWYQFFTESGTFLVSQVPTTDDSNYTPKDDFIKVRDFSDVGSDNLPETYDWVLDHLRKKI
jgi:hypothetical protein